MSVAEETRISLNEAADLLDVTERTVRSYAKNGIRGIRLEHIARPKKWETSKEAVSRFLDAMTVVDGPVIQPTEPHEVKRARLYAETAHLRRRNNQ